MNKNDWVSAGQQPAFPVAYAKNVPPDMEVFGISIRDYLAAKAMQSYILHPGAEDLTAAEIAHDAWMMADAMLKVREKQP